MRHVVRLAAAAVSVVLTLTTCGAGATPSAATVSPARTPSASTAPAATPAATPRLEIPVVLLDLRAGSGVTQPGTIPPPPAGGSLTRGPETHAVDDAGVVWLFDQAKSRVIAYDGGAFLRAVPVPDAPVGASALLIDGGRIYLRVVDDHGKGYREIELDGTTGRLTRSADLSRGDASLYPYARVVLGWIPSNQKGVDDVLGEDGHGNRYERHFFAQWSAGQCFSVIRRIDPAGRSVAEACFDVGSHARDYFVRRDGAVFQLEQLYTGPTLDRFAVTRVMSPAR